MTRELQPFRPTRTRPWDRATARHLLERAAFGGTTADIDQLVDLGPEDAVAKLLDFPQRGPDPAPDFVTIEFDPAGLRDLDQQERRKRLLQLQRQQRQAVVGLKAWWLERMITTAQPLEEKLTLFWHGHFATEADKVKSAQMLYDQNELFRTQGRGAFGDLLLAVGRDPAMLIYLDNHLNRKGHANENYARELFELFSLGIGNYTESDVLESARALTGWTLDRRRLYLGGQTAADFKPAMHDDGEKTVLGRTGDFGDQEIVDLILQQPSTPGFIVRKLWRFFVADEVADDDEPVLDYLARELRESGYQIGAALRELLSSNTFYDESRFGGRIKSPVELLVGTARRLKQAPEGFVVRLLSGALRGLGQDLFDPPNVSGWHGGREWINTSTLLQRYNVVGGMLLGMRRRRGGGPSLVETFADLETSDAGAIVDGLAQHLLAAPLDDAGRKELVALVADVLGGRGGAEEAVRTAAHLLTSTPHYQLC